MNCLNKLSNHLTEIEKQVGYNSIDRLSRPVKNRSSNKTFWCTSKNFTVDTQGKMKKLSSKALETAKNTVEIDGKRNDKKVSLLWGLPFTPFIVAGAVIMVAAVILPILGATPILIELSTPPLFFIPLHPIVIVAAIIGGAVIFGAGCVVAAPGAFGLLLLRRLHQIGKKTRHLEQTLENTQNWTRADFLNDTGNVAEVFGDYYRNTVEDQAISLENIRYLYAFLSSILKEHTDLESVKKTIASLAENVQKNHQIKCDKQKLQQFMNDNNINNISLKTKP